MKYTYSTFIIVVISAMILGLTWIEADADCSIGEGKRDCHSGSSCSSNNDCIFKLCENFVCMRRLSSGCKVGGKKKNCRLGEPCVSSDDCQAPGCAENDSGNTVCV
ncbi:18409_t:CDS:2 [Funneliformis geosporum]|uniref:16933_t:CDS:1 n=1 Tax=Funneliformis geosporum TaxID=1117311 RepID=A0A9W4WUC1_9GLOM|nr:16933_t:CDS:2 [Funneliformis geosporum]CAI2178934.1 18409_t:CDS:2 [Funneliformis geosporum]